MAPPPWDYLVITASDERQAASYEEQLALRRTLGGLRGVGAVLAVPDPGGARVGSGGSTVWALLKVLGKEAEGRAGPSLDPRSWTAALSKLRILIIHAGGDSRRLPAYAHCGKLFIPVPGDSGRIPGPALLDRLLPVYLGLPPLPEGRGQVVVTTGDVLLAFDPGSVAFADEGVTGLGSFEPPELAAGHGVFCPEEGGSVRRFLQKPSPAEQAAMGALDGRGRSALDIGVMSFDARTAVALIRLFDVGRDAAGGLTWKGGMAGAVERSGLDFYREICCAMGTEASPGEYRRSVRRAGSVLADAFLDRTFDRVSGIPFHVFPLRTCSFLHFGTPRQLIRSGRALVGEEGTVAGRRSLLLMNNDISGGGAVRAEDSWVEGCRVRAPMDLGGRNVVTGADVLDPLSLPPGAVLDIVEGRGRDGGRAFFVRGYGIDDVFILPLAAGAKLAGLPLTEWLEVMGATPDDVWDPGTPPGSRLAWNGRVFPRARGPEGYRKWLWMLDPKTATEGQKRAWKAADRYSLSEMTRLASPEAFHARRHRHRALEMARLGERIFRPEGETSAAELSFVLERLGARERREGLSALLDGAFHRFGGRPASGSGGLGLARALHTLGTAVLPGPGRRPRGWSRMLAGCFEEMPAPERAWFGRLGLSRTEFGTSARWAAAAKDAAFDTVGKAIVGSRPKRPGSPRCAMKSGEVVVGRAPVRLDLGGGWTDTPPYSLERGGAVINAAVDLDGRPPIRVQARVIAEPVLRLRSMDHGAIAVVCDLDDLLDYRRPGTAFGLAKAAITLAGFSPEAAAWPRGARTLERMLELFGGGIELATHAAIPSGSGLGTSSIMGAALLAVLYRLTGRRVSTRSLLHDVLRLEQELTTGGGWQDQVGGVVGGVKVIEADPGLVPNPRVRDVPSGLLDPARNGGTTLLYYTGIRRLAKGILRGVVGNVLDRDRRTMDTLAELRAFPSTMEAALRRGDAAEFGALIDLAWRLNKRIDPESTTPVIEDILSAVRPRVRGAKLLGAGGGGFLLMACRSAADARAVRRILAANPPNDEARFFDYSIDGEGLAVTVG